MTIEAALTGLRRELQLLYVDPEIVIELRTREDADRIVDDLDKRLRLHQMIQPHSRGGDFKLAGITFRYLHPNKPD